MTIFKNKVQRYEYNLRQGKIHDLQEAASGFYETDKRCLSELKHLLTEHVSDYDPNKFSVNLRKEHRRALQREGVLTTYLKTVNSMHDARNRYHSTLSKIERVRSVDFPKW